MYIFKNIKNFAKNESIMFLLLLIGLTVSFGVLFFAVGLFYQYNKNLEDNEIDNYAVGFTINDVVTKSDFESFADKIPQKLMNDVSYMTCFSTAKVSGVKDDVPLTFYLEYDNGKLGFSKEVFKPMLDEMIIINGRFFSQKEYENGDKVAIVMGKSQYYQNVPSPKGTDSITVSGEKYKVIGTLNPDNSNYDIGSVYIPFSSLPDDTELSDSIYLSLSKKITKSEYNQFSEFIDSYFGNKITMNKTAMDLKSDTAYYFTIILVSFCIALLSALNISVLYSYIISKRKRQLDIFRLCGGKSLNLCTITAGEIAVIIAPIGILSALIYSKLMLPLISEKFSLISQAYTPLTYFCIIAVYTIVTYIINFFMMYIHLKKSVTLGKAG